MFYAYQFSSSLWGLNEIIWYLILIWELNFQNYAEFYDVKKLVCKAFTLILKLQSSSTFSIILVVFTDMLEITNPSPRRYI